MPALFIFLFKVNIALVLFCIGYYLVLRHLTFYTLNRIYLVIAILFSTLYPNINLTDFAQHHQQLAQPVQTVILNWKAPAENFVKPLYQPDYWQWVELIFWAGVVLFAARLIMQLFSLYKLYRKSKPSQVHNYPVRLIGDDISPFSFWRSIYINPANLSPADLKGIVEHEHIHVSEWHTIDILLAELSTIFYWFNPGVWLMKKAVRENIEFITDQKILRKGMDSKQYQYSLVNVCLATSPNTIVNHFNISTIKKRIIMMNAKRSSGYNLTRYVFLVPAVVALLLVFSFSKAEVAKKSLHTFKSIAAAIGNVTLVNINNEKPHLHAIKVTTKVKPAAVKTEVKSTDTIYAGKSKDGKKSFFMTADLKADSIAYVINGVKATRAEVKALDPGKTFSMELLSPEKAKAFYPDADSKRYVLFVTTDDSEPGKKLKEKMDKTIGEGALARVKNITLHTSEASSNDAHIAGTGVSYSTSSTSESLDDAPVVLESTINNGKTSTVVVTNSKLSTKTLVKKNIHVTINQDGDMVVKNLNIDSPDTLNFAYATTKTSSDKKVHLFINKVAKNDELTIDSPGVLFMIDGKESKSFKNLSPADIKSISILKDEAAEKLYGKRGRNGVMIITTKKGSK
jgi:bla regulator protein BlaR1